MVKVFVHLYSEGNTEPDNKLVLLPQVPRAEELICVNANDKVVWRVRHVIYVAYDDNRQRLEDEEILAEVYCSPENHMDALKMT